MTQHFSGDPEELDRLCINLDNLILVLSRTIEKLKLALNTAPPGDHEEIKQRIVDLHLTLKSCQRARDILKARADEARQILQQREQEREQGSGRAISPRSELNEEDYRRVRNLPPIARDEASQVDWDAISKLL